MKEVAQLRVHCLYCGNSGSNVAECIYESGTGEEHYLDLIVSTGNR